MIFHVDEVDYSFVQCPRAFVCLDVWSIHDLAFHLIVSSRAIPIEVESFSIEVKRSFIGGELTVSWGNVADFYETILGDKSKPNSKV